VVVIYIANLLSFFWIEYAWGVLLGFGLPEFLLTRLV
jgi:F420-0:gamma-glutamyl ligase-like protein